VSAEIAHRPERAPHAGRRRPGALHRYLPPQHGAWALLLVPFVVGVACTRPVLLHVPLLVAWLAGYLLSYYALLALKTGRPGKVAGPLRLYAGLSAPAAALVAGFAPRTWAFAPAFAALLAVNAVLARRRDDRALAGGLASVAQSCLMVPLAAVVAGGSARGAALPALVLFAYFAGSLLYVKTMIRNRGERGYLVASITFSAAATVGVALVAWPLGVLFALLTARAAWLPTRRLTPKQVGLLEMAPCVALAVVLPLLLRV
jgi:hypothetical protein